MMAQTMARMIYDMYHIMSVDPCRRFVFGITIEKYEMRLWFCNRAMVVCTEPFDCIEVSRVIEYFYLLSHALSQERGKLRTTQAFLSFGFARKVDMGWDPTIIPIRDSSGTYHYEITVGGKVFRTTSVLQDLAPNGLIGRASRVYKVIDLEDRQAVVKDVWLEVDRKTEADIYDEVLASIEDDEERRIAERYLMKPDFSEIVEVEGGVRDDTREVMMRRGGLEVRKLLRMRTTRSWPWSPPWSVSFSLTTDIDHQEQGSVEGLQDKRGGTVRHRKHFRVVFYQVATPLCRMSNLGLAFKVLEDVMKGSYYCIEFWIHLTPLSVLRVIHDSGWVHRDISAANVYLFEEQGLLGDLEHARRENDDTDRRIIVRSVRFCVLTHG